MSHVSVRGKTRLQAACRACVCAGLSAALGLGGAAPALAVAADSSGETALYMQVDQSHLTTPEGYGDDQMRVTIPVAIGYVADELGNLTGPADGSTVIANNATAGAVHVKSIHAVAKSGVSLVASAAEADAADEVFLSVTPGTGTADSFGNYVTEAAPRAGDWDVAHGQSLALNGLGGKVGGFEDIDPATKDRFATVEWTVAAGTAEQAASEAARFVVHQVTPDAGTIDLVTTRTGTDSLAAGYVWHLGDYQGTVVSSLAEAVAAAGGASEVTLYGVAA